MEWLGVGAYQDGIVLGWWWLRIYALGVEDAFIL